MSEEFLWRAVMVQQFEDLLSQNELLKEQAKAWFTASIGTSVQDFEQVVEMAGFSPDLVRTIYSKLQDVDNPKEVFKSLRKVILE